MISASQCADYESAEQFAAILGSLPNRDQILVMMREMAPEKTRVVEKELQELAPEPAKAALMKMKVDRLARAVMADPENEKLLDGLDDLIVTSVWLRVSRISERQEKAFLLAG